MVPATVLEPVSECFLASLIIGWAAHHVFRYSQSGPGTCGSHGNVSADCVCFRWDMMVFFMCHCLAWFITDYIQLTGVQVPQAFIVKRHWYFLCFIRMSS